MGRFIRELDVCVRWQVAWQGREREKKEEETERNFMLLFAYGCISAGKHIYPGWVDCLSTAGGKSAATS